jgi:hypothetical protein
MEQLPKHGRGPLSRPLRIVLIGWAAILPFAALLVIARGKHDVGVGLAFGVMACAMAAWVFLRASKAALVTSLVLGVLHTVEQMVYLGGDFTRDPHRPLVTVSDLVGLTAGVLIIVGSALGLAARRHTSATAPDAQRHRSNG